MDEHSSESKFFNYKILYQNIYILMNEYSRILFKNIYIYQKCLILKSCCYHRNHFQWLPSLMVSFIKNYKMDEHSSESFAFANLKVMIRKYSSMRINILIYKD